MIFSSEAKFTGVTVTVGVGGVTSRSSIYLIIRYIFSPVAFKLYFLSSFWAINGSSLTR